MMLMNHWIEGRRIIGLAMFVLITLIPRENKKEINERFVYCLALIVCAILVI